MPLQRLPIRLLQLFVGQEGELIISCVYTLNTASQAMSRALVTQLFVKLCSSQGLSARFGSVIKLIIICRALLFLRCAIATNFLECLLSVPLFRT